MSAPPYDQPPSGTIGPNQQPSQPRLNKKIKFILSLIVAVVLAVVLIITGLSLVASVTLSTLTVRIQSTHSYHELDYRLYIDEVLMKSGHLGFFGEAIYEFDLWPGPPCQSYRVRVEANSDSTVFVQSGRSVDLCGGQGKSITLYL